jgi:hypothetical protein
MLHSFYQATDCGDTGAGMLFADFSKGFDLIDHNILSAELGKL